ncbi:MAG: metallophosphoesterase [Clostridiales bacterium]|nr:metallophosphoesterase [Candidatus Blautia equi]
MMWVIIMLITLLATLAIFAYLVSRFCKFGFIRRLAGGNRRKEKLLGLLMVFIIGAGCMIWLDFINTAVILLHLGVFWMLFDLIWMIFFRRVKSERYIVGTVTLIVTAAYLGCGWYLAHHVWEKDYSIQTEKQVEQLRIVQFADSHVGTTFHGDGFAKHMEEIQAVNPDVILLTGDFVDDESSKEDMIRSCEAMGRLQAKYGVYYSFGNHDKGYYGEKHRGYSGEELLAELIKNGVHVLQDEVVPIGEDYYLIGRQDRSEEQRGRTRASMEELTAELDPDRFSIVMDHQPHDYKAQAAAGVDLVLSGHTHGGQLFPLGYVGIWMGENDRAYGWEKRGTTNFIVTSGISDWAIRFKTGCRSEFVVIDVQSAE